MLLLNVSAKRLEEFDYPLELVIASHRWHHDEVLFQDIHADGLSYIWIDTCCIDKSSSAAVSEADNSMYAWYESAKVCYAYLDDVLSGEDVEGIEWFTRSGMLQGLLAAKSVSFFVKHWTPTGSKASLAHVVADTIGIHAKILVIEAARESLRGEDRAYSLMGTIHIHVPIIYGEGVDKAFTRLQHEIMQVSNNQSIFAWPQYSDSGDQESSAR
ncbi:hypothetical protein BS17DRAFT_802931 [Gyrodon lividus]|nr:hypothetical protein BS17DRAFT_802931 [Gyrodon lividus]